MPIPDKLAAAKKINEFLQAVVTLGGLRLKYRIIVDPPMPENRDWEKPEILVDFAGPRLRASARPRRRTSSRPRTSRPGNASPAFRRAREDFLRLPESALAAHPGTSHRRHRCRRKSAPTGTPYNFSPMSSRERRIVHLALRDQADLHTESEGEGMRRCLVVYPKDYKPAGRQSPKMIP